MSLIDTIYKETGMIWLGTEELLAILVLKCLLTDKPYKPITIDLTNDRHKKNTD